MAPAAAHPRATRILGGKEPADRLAAAATEVVHKIFSVETRTAQSVDLTGFRGTKPREGTIELW
jgi:hypothetical protein